MNSNLQFLLRFIFSFFFFPFWYFNYTYIAITNWSMIVALRLSPHRNFPNMASEFTYKLKTAISFRFPTVNLEARQCLLSPILIKQKRAPGTLRVLMVMYPLRKCILMLCINVANARQVKLFLNNAWLYRRNES